MRTGRENRIRRAGFTLVELLVVVAIIGILVTLVVAVGSHVRARGREDQTRMYLRVIDDAVEAYYEAAGKQWPEQDGASPAERSANLRTQLEQFAECEELLAELPSDVRKDGRFHDAFGMPIDYKNPGGDRAPVEISAGRDGSWGGSDDLRSDNQ